MVKAQIKEIMVESFHDNFQQCPMVKCFFKAAPWMRLAVWIGSGQKWFPEMILVVLQGQVYFALGKRKAWHYPCNPHICPSSDDSKLRSQKYSALKRTEGCQLLENIIWISTCSKPEDNTVSTMWMWESSIHNFSYNVHFKSTFSQNIWTSIFKTYLQTKWFLFGEVFVDYNL